jgi:CBS domain-containing protein
MKMKVKDLMTSQPQVVRPEDTASEAATLMKQEDCGAIPVVSKEGKLVGIVTDRDIVIRAVAAGKDPRSTPVSAIMTADPVTLSPDADDDDAEQLMAERQVRRLPVVEDGRLVGILVTAQLARRGNTAEIGETIKEISEPKSGRGSHARG